MTSKEEDGVSTTTGATREQIEAMAKQWWSNPLGDIQVPPWDDLKESIRDLARARVSEAVTTVENSGMVIASAADVAKVPTADELAAMRELVSNAPGFDETLDALTVVRAYLERVTG